MFVRRNSSITLGQRVSSRTSGITSGAGENTHPEGDSSVRVPVAALRLGPRSSFPECATAWCWSPLVEHQVQEIEAQNGA